MEKTSGLFGCGGASTGFYLLATMLLVSAHIAADLVNVAPTGTATQSTTGFGGVAERAIDGNTDGVYPNGSVTHTATGDPAPSWEVDLGELVEIQQIVLWNRTDCCANRLHNFEVEILDDTGAQVFSQVLFDDGTNFASVTTTVEVGGTSGQVVRVKHLGELIAGAGFFLALAEVQVLVETEGPPPVVIVNQPQGATIFTGDCFDLDVGLANADTAKSLTFQWQKNEADIAGATAQSYRIINAQPEDAGSYRVVVNADGTELISDPAVIAVPGQNLAIGGAATQSTTAFGGEAGRAIDGNTSGIFGAGSMTHTDNEPGAFWEVELFGDSTIDSVILWNRTECCANRLSNFRLSVLDSGRAEVFGVDLFTDLTFPSPSEEVEVGGVSGRIVRVQRLGPDSDGNNFVSLAEVQVLGTGPVAPPPPNLARRKCVTVTQSSTLGGFVAELAIDGNFGNFTHTLAGDSPATWEICLGAPAEIGSVVLHNRTSCCGSRLRDITVLILAADGESVVFQSELLNPENEQGEFPNGPPNLTVDVVALTGAPVEGAYVRVVRTPDEDFSGGGDGSNLDEGTVLSLGEVEIFEPAKSAQLAGDCNQDGARNISDVVCLIRTLFSGYFILDQTPPPAPCGTEAGDSAVLDVNGDSTTNVADITSLAAFLFSGGAPPSLGADCAPILADCQNPGCE